MLNAELMDSFGTELKNNILANNERIEELSAEYLAAEIADKAMQKTFKRAANKVLAENLFTVPCGLDERLYMDKKAGERITDDDDAYLLEGDEVDRYLDLCVKEYSAEGLTDKEGNYINGTNTFKVLCRRKDEVVKFMVSIIPEGEMQSMFSAAVTPNTENYSYKTYEGLFELFWKINGINFDEE